MSETLSNQQVQVALHRWWYQPVPVGLTAESVWAYQPKPENHYQKDHELGELYSLLTDTQVASVLAQMGEGKRVFGRLLFHVCDRHLAAILRMLKDGGMDPEREWQDLAYVGYVQHFHFENPWTAQAVLGWVQEAGADADDLVSAVRRHHWQENRQPEFVAAFDTLCLAARHGHTRLALKQTLPVNGHRTPKTKI